MGTDIHPAIEVRRDGIWRYHRPKMPCRWYEETYDTQADVDAANRRVSEWYARNPEHKRPKTDKPVVLGDRRNTWDHCKTRLPEFFTDRNYRVFSVVGDVRNDMGWGGHFIPPIQSSRGVPEDISRGAKAKLSDEHSAGWVTLGELKGYKYRQPYQEGGVVDEETYLALLGYRKLPQNWSGSIAGKDIVVLTPQAYAALYVSPIDLLQGKDAIKGYNYDTTKRYFIQAEWQRNLYESVETIPKEWIPYLEKLVPKGGTDDDVRVVFDFDS